MIKLDRPIIVEGKYDIIKLKNIIDAVIIKTDGFGIFKDKEKQLLLKKFAFKNGVIVMTDSDSGGFIIRNFIKSIIPSDKITHVYIPDVYGKEKRKSEISKEGKLGVEGLSEDVIVAALIKAGVCFEKNNNNNSRPITNIDLYEAGLSGGNNSKEKRKALLKALSLPERMSSTSMVDILNCFVTYEEFIEKVKELDL